MIKTIYINGCSWTAGHELDDMKNDSWPGQLESLTGLEVINESMCGGSNHRILRKTLKFLEKNKHRWNEILVVPAWSCPSRNEFYEQGSQQVYAKKFPELMEMGSLERNNDEDWVWVNQYRATSKDESVPNNVMAKYWYYALESPETSYYNYIVDVLALQNFCKANGIKYYMFRAFQFENIATPKHSWLGKYFRKYTQVSEYECEDIFREVADRGNYEELIDLVDTKLFPSFIRSKGTIFNLSETPIGIHPDKKQCGTVASKVKTILKEEGLI
jgi:hypothetical protein|tara:strand:+ start:1131 stop:1949 length:819 start_codon:yes stop_codon:yes gene_type:complete